MSKIAAAHSQRGDTQYTTYLDTTPTISSSLARCEVNVAPSRAMNTES